MKLKKQIEGKNFAVIETVYDKGGVNFASYKTERRGIYAHFSTKEIDDGWERYSPMSSENFKIFVKELGRKSAKQEKIVAEAFEARKEELFDAYIKNDREKIFSIIKEMNL